MPGAESGESRAAPKRSTLTLRIMIVIGKKKVFVAFTAALLLVGPGGANAQQQPSGTFTPGRPLGVTVGDQFTPMSDNVKVFGSFRFAESCTYDPRRDLIVAMNRGMSRDEIENDGYVSLVHPDGRVHTTKWIGETRDGLWLNDPLGSAIVNDVLYTVDVNFVRMFSMETGEPLGAHEVAGATGLNGIAVTPDGTIYASNTRATERIYRVTRDGVSSVFVEGAPLAAPNGVAIDPEGNVVVVNVEDNAVLTFSPAGRLVRTEHAVQPGNDGIVILADGTKYVSSVREGGVSRIRPGRPAELIATGIPSAASMCYDPVRHQLVIPMNNHNALAFLPLED
jgi:DNA-binding beta-propeller fold protein YncE